MAFYDDRTIPSDQDSEQRSWRAGRGSIGRRLTDAFRRDEDPDPRPARGQLATWLLDERGSVGEDVLPRFPRARNGYDCVAVDVHIAELERELAGADQELAELRAQHDSRTGVEREIQRIGEQTSAVLIAAHEQREEMLRAAQVEADRCVADARATAHATTARAEARLRELSAETEAAHRERDGLLEDARTVSVALAALADSAHERIPPMPASAVPAQAESQSSVPPPEAGGASETGA